MMNGIKMTKARRGMRAAALIALSAFLSACDMMHQDDGDCSTKLRVKLTYDYNMKFADAFAHEVKNVTLYAFGQDGKLAYTKTESADIINAKGYMEVDDLTPGIYDLQVWAEGEDRHPNSYVYGQAVMNQSSWDDLTCFVNETATDISHDLTPLYWGRAEKQDLSELPQEVRTAVVNLHKNTNVIRVVLQHASGKDVNPDDFEFSITDDNTRLAADNSLIPHSTVIYHPWATYGAEAGVETQTKAQTTASAAIAEMTVNRLFVENRPMLTITNRSNGKTVLSIPLIDYVLLVKGNYNRSMSDQEYLDRQDEYNMTFFLQDDGSWLAASIIINSWRVVLSSVEL